MNINVYTDGSCYPNPGPEGGWGCVVLAESLVIMLFGRIYGDAVTNNIAELLGLINGMKALPEGHNVNMVTDSLWSKNALEGTWNVTKNLGLVADGKNEMHRLGWKPRDKGALKIRHIRGHKGNLYNEMADDLAGRPWKSLPNMPMWDGRKLSVVCVKDPRDATSKVEKPTEPIEVPGLVFVDSPNELRLVL